MTVTRCLACLVGLSFAASALAAGPAEFRFTKPIDRGSSTAEELVGVPFDADVYAATRPEYPDLRIFDAAGHEVPCLLEKVTETRTQKVREACASRVVSLTEQADGVEVIVQLDDRSAAAEGLAIYTPLTNFERRVRVLGREEGMGWTTLVADGLVFDYARYMDVSNREIRLPKNGCRQFKVSIAGIADSRESPLMELTRKYRGGKEAERVEKTVLERRPFRMDRLELWYEKDEKSYEYDKKADYPVVQFRVEQNAGEKTTIVHVVTRREPLTGLTIETSDRNFSRQASVEIPVKQGVRTDWVEIGRDRLSLLDFGKYHSQSLGIAFPETRQGEYRIVIRNQDNPPLAVTGVKARGNVYRAVFLAAAKETYRLGYGSDDARQPSYDAAAVLTPLRLEGHRPIETRLGQQVANPAVAPPPSAAVRSLLNNPLLLGGAIVVLVIVLGWALFRATLRINQMPKE
jgi:hypothetical protein